MREFIFNVNVGLGLIYASYMYVEYIQFVLGKVVVLLLLKGMEI